MFVRRAGNREHQASNPSAGLRRFVAGLFNRTINRPRCLGKSDAEWIAGRRAPPADDAAAFRFTEVHEARRCLRAAGIHGQK